MAWLGLASAGHSNLISPKPRNAIDSRLPQWAGGKSPAKWEPHGDNPCACRNGSSVCDIGQTCLWMSVGCSIGCKECDGGQEGKGVTNPNSKDRCGSGMKPTNNDPSHRSFNRNCTGDCVGSALDYTQHNPWRAPGAAPVFDPCGRAGGGPVPTAGHGEYINTSFARFGDLGSQLPVSHAAVWKAGSVVETIWSIRANHGGGYQYRLCPLQAELTEACFQATPLQFAGNSRLMMADGATIEINSTFVSEGTRPPGSTWQMNPLPMTHDYTAHGQGGPGQPREHPFAPPCHDPCPAGGCPGLSQGLCSGEWMRNITLYDQLRVPASLAPGEWVLGFRWDCESSAQVWQSCADITITN